MTQAGIENYDKAFFLRNIKELRDWRQNRIRLEDMGSAIRYALGFRTFESAQRGLTAVPFASQVKQMWDGAPRRPSFVVDIGCGRGEVCSFFTRSRIKCVGIDPSPGAAELFPKTLQDWTGMADRGRYCQFWNVGALGGVRQLEAKMGKAPDSVMFTESIEHIPRQDMEQAYPIIAGWLRRTKGLLVVVNWLKYFPILPNPKKPWCHVTTVDDAYYDWLASFADHVVFRRKSHLVLQF